MKAVRFTTEAGETVEIMAETIEEFINNSYKEEYENNQQNNEDSLVKMVMSSIKSYITDKLKIINIVKSIREKLAKQRFFNLTFNKQNAIKTKIFKDKISQTIIKLNTYINQFFDFIQQNTLLQNTYIKTIQIH